MTYKYRIMAYTSLPKLVPIRNSKLNLEDIKNNKFGEIFQSEPAKRLLTQPSIVIKAISPSLSDTQKILNADKSKNDQNRATSCENLMSLMSTFSYDEDNLLPSKKQGKSEITLLPIKRERKSCGHYEPCENIICDVNIQQYIDHEGSSMLTVNIDDSEITASVSKHCKNSLCDSLSIDHNRCRRAIIYLYRCDKSSICDICKTPLKTRKSRVYHRNCKRKDEYQHNQVNGAQVLRERMRERELQLMEAVRTKQNDYSDPLTGHVKAMEVLKNNSELIIIPNIIVSMPQYTKPSDSSINSWSNSALRNVNCTYISTKLNSYLEKITSDIESHSINTALSRKPKDKLDNDDFIVTAMSQTNIAYPLALNDWVITPSLKSSTVQSQNSYFMPVKVIPIKNLKSEPSLQHHTRGIPKFCIVPDNSVPSPSFVSVQNITSFQNQEQSIFQDTINELKILQNNFSNAPKSAQVNIAEFESFDKKEMPHSITSKFSSRKYFDDHKKQVENKVFQCSYCSKRFLTDWYFKLHVTRHTGEKKVTCKNCDMTFTSNYDLKRHINIEHKDAKSHVEKIDEIGNKVNKEKYCSASCDKDKNILESNNKLEMQKYMNFKKSIRLKEFEERTSSMINKIHKKKKL